MPTVTLRPISNPPKVVWHLDVDPKEDAPINQNSPIKELYPTSLKTVEIQDELVSPTSSLTSSKSAEPLASTALTSDSIVSENAVVPVSDVQEMVPEHILTPSEIVVPLTEDANIHHAPEASEAAAETTTESSVTQTISQVTKDIAETILVAAAGVAVMVDVAIQDSKKEAKAKEENEILFQQMADMLPPPVESHQNIEIEKPSEEEVQYERLPSTSGKLIETATVETAIVESTAVETTVVETVIVETVAVSSDNGFEEAAPLFPASVTSTLSASDSDSSPEPVSSSPAVVMNSFIDREYTLPATINTETTVADDISQTATPYSSAFSSPVISPTHAKESDVPKIAAAPKPATPVVRGSRINMLLKQHEEAIVKAKEVTPSAKRT